MAMKLFHLSDLHIGKQLHGFSLIEDQAFILETITELVRERKPDAVLIAGDVYDKAAPSAEAVAVFDEFLTALASIEDGPAVFLISGNHDSQERISFGSRLFSGHRIYIAGCAPDKARPEIVKIVLADQEGDVNFYLLPFLRPSYVREIPGMETVKTYGEAVDGLLKKAAPDYSARNVLLCHQFFTWNGKEPERSESETVSVGGQDNIDVSVVEAFDYVAAGHIHRPQSVKDSHIRYCGSPLKYSVSEAPWEKSVTEVTLGKKGEVTVEKIPLKPLRDVRRIKGTLAELTSPETLKAAPPEDYISAVLTDEEDLYDPGAALARVYPNLLEWRVENSRTVREMEAPVLAEEKKGILELFGDFYEQMRGTALNEKQMAVMKKIAESAGRERE